MYWTRFFLKEISWYKSLYSLYWLVSCAVVIHRLSLGNVNPTYASWIATVQLRRFHDIMFKGKTSMSTRSRAKQPRQNFHGQNSHDKTFTDKTAMNKTFTDKTATTKRSRTKQPWQNVHGQNSHDKTFTDQNSHDKTFTDKTAMTKRSLAKYPSWLHCQDKGPLTNPYNPILPFSLCNVCAACYCELISWMFYVHLAGTGFFHERFVGKHFVIL